MTEEQKQAPIEVQRYTVFEGWIVADEGGRLVTYEAFRALAQRAEAADRYAERLNMLLDDRDATLSRYEAKLAGLNDEAAHERNLRSKFETNCKVLRLKLAELEKQEPDIMVSAEGAEAIRAIMNREMSAAGRYVTLKRPSRIGEEGMMGVYTRPAPAADLAELVPDEMPTSYIYHGGSGAFNAGKESGWNACRAAILRKIEEAK